MTMPPHTWFGGVDFDFAVEMVAEARRLGACVLPVDTAGFVVQNPEHIRNTLASLRSFKPDVALSTPNAGYALLCKTAEDRNVFVDELEIPSIMLWDHGLLQFPKLCLDPLPSVPAEAAGGAIERMRTLLDRPLYRHYSPDRGHIDALDRLGVISRHKVHHFLQPAYPNFVNYGYRQPSAAAFRAGVSFAGNVYLNAASELPFADEPMLKDIQSEVLSRKRQRLTEPLWDLLVARISTVDEVERRRLELTPDSTFFWRFMHDEIELVGNTEVRLDVLSGLRHEYQFYGNFVEPDTTRALRQRYRVNVRKSLDYFTELPLLFMNSDVIVDVVNLGYRTGISPKIMGCLACGGLVLFDYKEDFFAALGEAGMQIMYRTVDELNTLVDRYLGNPRERRDVARQLQHVVSTTYSFASLCRRLFVDEPAWRE